LYHYRAKSVGTNGVMTLNGDYAFTTASTVVVDVTPPNVALTVPAAGTTVFGPNITLSANATDNVGVASVQFQVDGVNSGAAITTAPYTYIWDTTAATNAAHTITAIAKDAAGNTTTTGPTTVTVDNAAPVISAVTATVITQSAATITWSTDKATTSQIDYGITTSYGTSTPFNSTQTTSHSISLSGLAANTTYHYHVKSISNNNMLGTSADFTFTTAVDTTPVVISAVANSVPTQSSVTITWSTDKPADSQINYGLTTYYTTSTPLDATLTTSHSVTVTGLTPGTLYHYRAKSVGTNGVMTLNGDYAFTTASALTSPNVAVTLPTANAIVTGSTVLTATATDAFGIAKVQFQVDGINVGTAITAAPYTMVWNSITVTNGAHVITAVATDTTGAADISSGISVSVSNNGLVGLTATVTASKLNVRSTPAGALIGIVTYGTKGIVTATSTAYPNWVQVQFPTIKGWVSKSYVTIK
jgi:hypothetical protein